ncbi:MAG: ABC transporter substrate-binding protein [Alphaproteobacteria bacterium]|nr:ABC transporter substrate-binding protein [Alphaproteobacteria bacterium]
MFRKTAVRLLCFATVILALAAGYAGTVQAADPVKIKFILNWKWQGPQAWFFIAQDKGWFKEEGLDVQLDQGSGSAAAVTRVASGAYDAGFGDINAITRFKSEHPDHKMKAVYMIYNVPPFVIVSLKEKGIKSPKDLEGKVLGASANDAAFKLFPGFVGATGIDDSKIEWQHMKPSLRQQMLVRGDVDAVAGYYITVKFGLKNMNFDPEKANFMFYSDHGMDLYSNAIIFSGDMIEKHPDAVKGFLRAVNKAFFYVLDNRDEGIDAAMKRERLLKRDVEMGRLVETIDWLIVSPEMKEIGMGDVKDERLSRSIKIVSDTFGLKRTPDANEIFDRSFLPAKADRMAK